SHFWSSGWGMIKPALYLFTCISSFAASPPVYQRSGQEHRHPPQETVSPFFVLAAWPKPTKDTGDEMERACVVKKLMQHRDSSISTTHRGVPDSESGR